MLSYRGVPFPRVQAGSSQPRAACPSWSPLCRAEKRAFEAAAARLAPSPGPPGPRWSPGCHPPIYTPLAPLAATTADTKTITNRFARAMGRGQREVGRRRREAAEGGQLYPSLSASSRSLRAALSSLSPARLLVPLSGYCIENVMLKYACTRVGPMVRNLASSFCGSTYPDVFLCTPRERESACTLLAHRRYCVTSGRPAGIGCVSCHRSTTGGTVAGG